MSRTLYRTKITIYTAYDPLERELVDLAQEATSGNALCTRQTVEEVPVKDIKDDAVLSFFNVGDADGAQEEGSEAGEEAGAGDGGVLH